MREMQIPFRKIMVRKKTWDERLWVQTQSWQRIFFLIKYPFKCTSIIILSWNLLIIEE